jgi:hypothetical protein
MDLSGSQHGPEADTSDEGRVCSGSTKDGEFLYYMRQSAFEKGVPEATCCDRNFWIRL